MPERAGARGLLLGAAVKVPVLTAIVCILVLLAAASGLSHLRLGNPVLRGLPQSSEPRQGYDAAAAGIGPGVLGPTMLVLEGPGIAGQRSRLGQLSVSARRRAKGSSVRSAPATSRSPRARA